MLYYESTLYEGTFVLSYNICSLYLATYSCTRTPRYMYTYTYSTRLHVHVSRTLGPTSKILFAKINQQTTWTVWKASPATKRTLRPFIHGLSLDSQYRHISTHRLRTFVGWAAFTSQLRPCFQTQRTVALAPTAAASQYHGRAPTMSTRLQAFDYDLVVIGGGSGGLVRALDFPKQNHVCLA